MARGALAAAMCAAASAASSGNACLRSSSTTCCSDACCDRMERARSPLDDACLMGMRSGASPGLGELMRPCLEPCPEPSCSDGVYTE
jgi:hypothetical protein